MASLTGGFAPIAGAGASRDKAKKSDLTSGLISLNSGGTKTQNKSDDLDFSDFDVDDLLLDDAGGGSKGKNKSKEKSPSPSPKKKKSSSSGSSKKKKGKKKSNNSGGALDFVNEDENEWDKEDDEDGRNKTRKSFDPDEFVVPAKKKNARLDDEFARMLGLEDEFGDGGTVASGVENGDTDFGDLPVKRTNDVPGVMQDDVGKQPVSKNDDVSPLPQEENAIDGGGGLNASFFQDDSASQTRATDDDDGIRSFISSSDRRGERSGGRRGGGIFTSGGEGKPLFADPFAKSDAGGSSSTTSGRRVGGLDDLFSSSSSRTSANSLESGHRQGTKSQSTLDSLFGGDGKTKTVGDSDNSTGFKPVSRSTSGATASLKSTAPGNAKEDLLSELFPAEAPRASKKQDSHDDASVKIASSSLSKATTPANANDDLLSELFPPVAPRTAPKKLSSPPKDENVQYDDLLAELFPDEVKKAPRSRDPEPTQPPSSSLSIDSATTETKISPPSPLPVKLTDSGKADILKSNAEAPSDADSARDSLLKDLLPDSPRRDSRRSVTWAPEVTEKATETISAKANTDSFTGGARAMSSTATFPDSQSSQPPAVLSTSEPTPPKQSTSPAKALPAVKVESPLPSPGKTKTLTLGTPSKARDLEFEQSKDDLLEEILSSAPSSPLIRSPDPTNSASPRSRRSSYSLSFDQDGIQPATMIAQQDVPCIPQRRRGSRSPEKQEQVSSSLTVVAIAPPPTQTVFLRDVHAEELKKLHAAAIVEMEARHVEALTKASIETQQLQIQLHKEQVDATSRAAACSMHTLQIQELQNELADVRETNARLTGEVQLLQTQHTLQKTQVELFDREKAALVRQLSVAEDQQRAVVTQLSEEKLTHQQTQLAFTTFKRETEQASQLRTEKERAQMDRLYHQLQHSLAQLTMLQEQSSEEATTKRELEAATRLRMINSLETTSRGYAQQTQDECHRLTSLLSSLEATLRAYRQEHLEEKERLRQEQMRLNVLAQHFQAQTSVLNEKSDANAQLLAQHLGASLHDTRAAEARLALRRQQLADDEQNLYSERALFASHREAWIEQRQRETAEIEAQRASIEREWRALQRERDDLDDVIASHEDAFRALQQQQLVLEAEKDRVAVGALHVAEMAQKFEVLTKQIVNKEHEVQKQRNEMDDLRRQWAVREQSVSNERRKLDERETRLHTQLKQMETARRKMNDERREQLQRLQSHQRQRTGHKASVPEAEIPTRPSHLMATVSGVRAHVMSANNTVCSTPLMHFMPSVSPPGPQPFVSSTFDPINSNPLAHNNPPEMDPSGFSPSFRQLVEENWNKQSRDTEAALHKERMAIHCLGLDTTARLKDQNDDAFSKMQRSNQVLSPVVRSAAQKTPTLAKISVGIGASARERSRPPPPPPSSSISPSQPIPHVMSVHL